MPAGDFAPGNAAAVNVGKVYLIKGSTLKELLKRISFAVSDFDVSETADGRMVELKKSSSPGESASEEGVTADFALLDCLVNPLDPEADPATWIVDVIFRIVVENGKIVSLNETYSQRAPATGFSYRFIQSCCWVDDPPEDDWRA